MRTSLTNVLSDHGVLDLLHLEQRPDILNTNILNKNTTAEPQRQAHYYNGRFHLVPDDFVFPEVTARVIFQYWFCGNFDLGYPAFKYLAPQDMHTNDCRKRLVRIGMWKNTSNVNEINEMFDAVIGRIGIPATTPKGRQKRIGQLGWRTAYKLKKLNKLLNINLFY